MLVHDISVAASLSKISSFSFLLAIDKLGIPYLEDITRCMHNDSGNIVCSSDVASYREQVMFGEKNYLVKNAYPEIIGSVNFKRIHNNMDYLAGFHYSKLINFILTGMDLYPTIPIQQLEVKLPPNISQFLMNFSYLSASLLSASRFIAESDQKEYFENAISFFPTYLHDAAKISILDSGLSKVEALTIGARLHSVITIFILENLVVPYLELILRSQLLEDREYSNIWSILSNFSLASLSAYSILLNENKAVPFDGVNLIDLIYNYKDMSLNTQNDENKSINNSNNLQHQQRENKNKISKNSKKNINSNKNSNNSSLNGAKGKEEICILNNNIEALYNVLHMASLDVNSANKKIIERLQNHRAFIYILIRTQIYTAYAAMLNIKTISESYASHTQEAAKKMIPTITKDEENEYSLRTYPLALGVKSNMVMIDNRQLYLLQNFSHIEQLSCKLFPELNEIISLQPKCVPIQLRVLRSRFCLLYHLSNIFSSPSQDINVIDLAKKTEEYKIILALGLICQKASLEKIADICRLCSDYVYSSPVTDNDDDVFMNPIKRKLTDLSVMSKLLCENSEWLCKDSEGKTVDYKEIYDSPRQLSPQQYQSSTIILDGCIPQKINLSTRSLNKLRYYTLVCGFIKGVTMD